MEKPQEAKTAEKGKPVKRAIGSRPRLMAEAKLVAKVGAMVDQEKDGMVKAEPHSGAAKEASQDLRVQKIILLNMVLRPRPTMVL